MGTDDTFFFEQTPFKKREKRLKKHPDDLPQDLRFAHLNPRVAAYLASKEKENQRDEAFNDGLGSKSLLPQISRTVSLLKNKLDSFLNDEDQARYNYQEAKVRAESILQQLERLLIFFEGTRLTLPRSLHIELSAQFKDLIVNAVYVKREWQNTGNKALYFAKKAQEETLQRMKLDEALKQSTPSVHLQQDTRASTVTDDDGRESSLDGKSSRAKTRQSTRVGTNLKPESKDKPLENTKSKARLDKYRASTSTTCDQKSLINLGSGNQSSPEASGRNDTLSQAGNKGRRSSVDRQDDPVSLDTRSTIGHIEGRASGGGGRDVGYWAVISFQLSNKVFADKGWIVNPSGPEANIERNTVLEWALGRLQEMLQKKREEMQGEYEAGADYPIILKFYGEARKEQIGSYSRPVPGTEIIKRNPGVWKGEKPKIPSLDFKHKGKSIFQATISDGSSTVFYPSGRPAIVASRSETGRSFYTVVYADVALGGMLAMFTPSGKGCVYHQSNGRVNFLCNDDGGSLADEDGNITKRWNWPKNPAHKMHSTVVVPVMRTADYQVHFGEKMNPSITLRCTGHHHMQLFYACGRESAKFQVGVGIGEDREKVPSREELGTLQSGYSFSSKTASDFSRPYFKPPPVKQPRANKGGRGGRGKTTKDRERDKGAIQEVQKILEYPEPVENDEEADKELYKLQRKVKQTAETWMEHYRIAMGLPSPLVEAMKDLAKLKPRKIHSAKPGGGRVIIEATATSVPKVAAKVRAPSAPPGQQRYRPASSVILRATPVSFEEESEGMEYLMEDGVVDIASMSSGQPRIRAHSAAPGGRTTPGGVGPGGAVTPEWNPILNMCPVALRQYMLGDASPRCRCSNYHLPSVTDIEFDDFVRRLSPIKQLIVIAVKSSLYQESSRESEEMLERMYEEKNRNRSKPCLQSRPDHNRVFMYDMATAAEMSDHTQPLLLRRHNVCPGMFLIYEHGQLLFCDHIFNGYGNARKDLQKQLMQSQRMASIGHHLPRDFKFSPQKGRPGPRAAWGGEIGGAGVDHYGKTGTGLSDPKISITSLSSGDSNQTDGNMISGVNCSTKYISVRLSSGRYPQISRSTLEVMLRKRREEKEKQLQREAMENADSMESVGEGLPEMINTHAEKDRKDHHSHGQLRKHQKHHGSTRRNLGRTSTTNASVRDGGGHRPFEGM